MKDFFAILGFFFSAMLFADDVPDSKDFFCKEYFAAPPLGMGFFPAGDRNLYFLQTLGVDASGTAPKKPTLPLWKLLRIPLDTHRIEKVLQFHFAPLSALLVKEPQRDQLGYAMFFHFDNDECNHGNGQYSALPLNASEYAKASGGSAKAMSEKGTFYAVYAANEIVLFDDQSHSMIDYDIKHMQVKKKHILLSNDETLLFVDTFTQSKVLWTQSFEGKDKISGIERIVGQQVRRKLKFEVGTKLLRQGRNFGAVQYDKAKNELSVFKLDLGSQGKDATDSYKIYLEKDKDLSVSNYLVNFDRSVLVAISEDISSGLNLQRLRIFDFTTGWVLADIKAPTNMELGYVGLSGDGQWVAVETKSSLDKKTLNLALFSLARRRWMSVSLKG